MISKKATALTAALLAGLATSAAAQDEAAYEVEITNVTRGEIFTPILLASHEAGVRIFQAGEEASAELEVLAEAGNVAPLETLLMGMPSVLATTDSNALLHPGESVTLHIETRAAFDHLSLAAMLIPSNDAFFGLADIAGPKGDKTIILYSPAYDAGTEPNSELCADIPGGGGCGGEGLSAEDGEGYVHVHAGIHGIGDLAPSDYDWRNPVARIRISRIPAFFQ